MRFCRHVKHLTAGSSAYSMTGAQGIMHDFTNIPSDYQKDDKLPRGNDVWRGAVVCLQNNSKSFRWILMRFFLGEGDNDARKR